MIQSVLFNKHLWSQFEARKYLMKHGFKDYGVDETENELRYRQHEPDSSKKYYTKTLRGGVQYIIMY
jgi:hypothetical protein